MKKIINTNYGKLQLTSNMRVSNLKSFYDFSKKQQETILSNFDYLETEEIKELYYIDEFTSFNDILLLSSCWTSTSEKLVQALENIVNSERLYNYYFSVGYIQESYTRSYYAINQENYIKFNIKVVK